MVWRVRPRVQLIKKPLSENTQAHEVRPHQRQVLLRRIGATADGGDPARGGHHRAGRQR